MCIKVLTLTVCICPHRDDSSLCPHATNVRLSPLEILDEPFTAQGWATRLPTVLQGHVDWKFPQDQTQWEHCPTYKARNRHSSDHGTNGSKIIAGREISCPETQELAGRLDGQWTRVVRRLCEECEHGHGVETRGLLPQPQKQRQDNQMPKVAFEKQPIVALDAVGVRRAAIRRRASMIPTAGGRERLSVVSKTTSVRSDESWIREGLSGRIPVQRKAIHVDTGATTGLPPQGWNLRGNMNAGSSNGGRLGLVRSIVGSQKKSLVWQKKE